MKILQILVENSNIFLNLKKLLFFSRMRSYFWKKLFRTIECSCRIRDWSKLWNRYNDNFFANLLTRMTRFCIKELFGILVHTDLDPHSGTNSYSKIRFQNGDHSNLGMWMNFWKYFLSGSDSKNVKVSISWYIFFN